MRRARDTDQDTDSTVKGFQSSVRVHKVSAAGSAVSSLRLAENKPIGNRIRIYKGGLKSNGKEYDPHAQNDEGNFRIAQDRYTADNPIMSQHLLTRLLRARILGELMGSKRLIIDNSCRDSCR